MKKLLAVLFVLAGLAGAQDITLSKDTYNVRNPFGYAKCPVDTVTIINSGLEPVALDSILIEVEDLDTTTWIMEKPPYLRIDELFGDGERGINVWNLDPIGNNAYRCIPDSTFLTSDNLLGIGASGDSIRLAPVMIGSCMMCAAIYVLPFSHAVLQLCYSNGQKVELNLEYSGDVVTSKDSLKVYNNLVSSFLDGVKFYNNGKVATALDSAVIRVEVFDTTGFRAGMALEAGWSESNDSSGITYTMMMTERDDGSFLLEQDVDGGGLVLPQPFSSFGPGDSVAFGHLVIGQCLYCAVMPTYPKYIRGMLHLYFDNGERVGLQLYSEDLREPLTVESVSVVHRAIDQNPGAIYLLNGRLVGEKPYVSLRPGAGNCMIIHDTKRIQPVIYGLRRYNDR